MTNAWSRSASHLSPAGTHESHICKLPVPPQLPVNKNHNSFHPKTSFSPKYGGDIVREVVPSEGESVGGLEERRSGHVGVEPASDCNPACNEVNNNNNEDKDNGGNNNDGNGERQPCWRAGSDCEPAWPAPCLTYQLRGLAGYLSRPGPTSRAYLIPQGRLSSTATQRTTPDCDCITTLGKHCPISHFTACLSRYADCSSQQSRSSSRFSCFSSWRTIM